MEEGAGGTFTAFRSLKRTLKISENGMNFTYWFLPINQAKTETFMLFKGAISKLCSEILF